MILESESAFLQYRTFAIYVMQIYLEMILSITCASPMFLFVWHDLLNGQILDIFIDRMQIT